MAATTEGDLTGSWTLLATGTGSETIVVYTPRAGDAELRKEEDATVPDASKSGHPFYSNQTVTMRLGDGHRLWHRSLVLKSESDYVVTVD